MRAVDLFAGLGGFTLAAERAGCEVVWAGNHWQLAVDAHRRNHPSTEHSCQDLRQADWSELPPFELLLASPACQGHSTASQPKRRPKHDKDRATAWAVIGCADVCEPKAIIVENVPRFRDWRLYSTWVQALQLLGYHVSEHILNAADFGVPQLRRRLFVIATQEPFTLRMPRRRPVSFERCIDFDVTPGWRPVSSVSAKAQKRMRDAKRNHGPLVLSQHVTNHQGVPLDEQIRTITTKDQWWLVDGRWCRPLTIRELARGQAFPESYELPPVDRRRGVRLIGNALPPDFAEPIISQVRAA